VIGFAQNKRGVCTKIVGPFALQAELIAVKTRKNFHRMSMMLVYQAARAIVRLAKYPPIGNRGISEPNIAAAGPSGKTVRRGIARVPGPDFGRRHLRSVGTISRGTDGSADIEKAGE
jgi:hypothetical protein